ncbi:papilin-like [Saccostrea cucullata]|uniref:papilin-like n=1 Tax=Saccostrea cuccullata TaxID=36930 RepID=UPI002ED1F539
MKGTVILLLSSVCAFAQYVPQGPIADQPSRPKPGSCPVSDIITTCECNPANELCQGDNKCPGVQKCCSYGCGCRTHCVNPVGVGSGNVCVYNGRKYKVGERFPSEDGCNTCTCNSNGGVGCTEKACIGQDICSLPKVVGRCRAAFRRWWFNTRTNRCERFIYGGCRGNENNFESRRECERRCRNRAYPQGRPGRSPIA